MLCPDFLQEMGVQELQTKDGLSFVDARKNFLAHEPTIGNQSLATDVGHPRAIEAASQTTDLLYHGVESVVPRTTVPSQSEGSTQTEALPTSTVTGVKLLACQGPALDIRHSHNST
jgi:hypothetical protein